MNSSLLCYRRCFPRFLGTGSSAGLFIGIAALLLLQQGRVVGFEEQDETSRCAELLVESWKKLEGALSAEMFPDHVIDTLTAAKFQQSATFRRLLKSGNPKLWDAMLGAADSPIVAMAGYHCIAVARPDDTRKAALIALASAHRPGRQLYAPFYSELQRTPWRDDDVRCLAPFGFSRTRTKTNLILLTGAIDIDALAGWFESDQTQLVSPQGLAVVMDRLYGDVINGKRKPTKKMRRVLDEFAAIPGFCRYVFAFYGDVADPRLATAIQHVLCDPTLSDIELPSWHDEECLMF